MGEPPEHTHEGDLVREAQPIVGAPPQGDLSSVGLKEGGIADQAGPETSGSETGTVLSGRKHYFGPLERQAALDRFWFQRCQTAEMILNDLDNLSASFVSVWEHRFFPCETGREVARLLE